MEGDHMGLQKIYIELTDDCNLNCKMCYRRSWGNVFGDMKNEVLHKLVNEIKEQDEIREIVIGGIGEPTYAKNFIKALELLKDYSITVTTNGTLINEELAEYLIQYVDNITVSIDGTPDTFQEIRGIELRLVENNIKMLNMLKDRHNSKKPVVDVQFVLSDENKNDIFKVIDIAKELKANRFIVSNIIPQIEVNKDSILYTRYENIEIKNLFQKIILYSMKKGIMVSLPNFELKTIRECRFVENSSAFICSSGEISPCYRFSHDYTEYVFGRKKQIKKFIFGSLELESLKDIWNHENYTKFRERLTNNKYPSCLDCNLVDGCDYVTGIEDDCFGLSPSCGDCLWSRTFTQCP